MDAPNVDWSMGSQAARLAVALADTRLRLPAGRRATLRYAATVRARVVLRVIRRGRALVRVSGRARAGANRIGFRTPRRAGRYRLRLEARTADGRRVSAGALLMVRAAGQGRV